MLDWSCVWFVALGIAIALAAGWSFSELVEIVEWIYERDEEEVEP
jgi:hypothetical protein